MRFCGQHEPESLATAKSLSPRSRTSYASARKSAEKLRSEESRRRTPNLFFSSLPGLVHLSLKLSSAKKQLCRPAKPKRQNCKLSANGLSFKILQRLPFVIHTGLQPGVKAP